MVDVVIELARQRVVSELPYACDLFPVSGTLAELRNKLIKQK